MPSARSGPSPCRTRNSFAMRLVWLILLSGHISVNSANETISLTPTIGIDASPNTDSPVATTDSSDSKENPSSALALYGPPCALSCASTAVVTRTADPTMIQRCVSTCVVSVASVAVAAPLEPDNYFNWPVGDSLFSYMDDQQFAHFNVLLLFGSVVIAGLGSEVVVGQYIVENLSSDTAAALWVYAQVCFPLFISIGVFAQSVFGLPFLVLGMWKFGFPETLAYWVKVNQIRKARGWLNGECIGNICNGLGLLFHHISSAYFVTCGSVGYNQLTRYARGMMTPLVLQHWVVLFRYVHFELYCGLAFLLEFIWEFEVFFGVRYLRKNFEVAIIFLLIAHWLFLAAFFFESLDRYLQPKQVKKGDGDPLTINFKNPNRPEPEPEAKNPKDFFSSRAGLVDVLFDAVEKHEAADAQDQGIGGGRASLLNAGLGVNNEPRNPKQTYNPMYESEDLSSEEEEEPAAKGRHSILGWKTTLGKQPQKPKKKNYQQYGSKRVANSDCKSNTLGNGRPSLLSAGLGGKNTPAANDSDSEPDSPPARGRHSILGWKTTLGKQKSKQSSRKNSSRKTSAV